MRYAVQAVQPGTAMTAKVAASGETPGLFIFVVAALDFRSRDRI